MGEGSVGESGDGGGGLCVFFFKVKAAFVVMSGDWGSDVCSSDLGRGGWNRRIERKSSCFGGKGGIGEMNIRVVVGEGRGESWRGREASPVWKAGCAGT